ncbi:MAG: L-threonylcarbamoyladenylate synthase [Acholeplasma sp.]|nr:L-threonylcarbamoyladenylate synthase [Acholeplasma sp.]
MMVDEYSLEEGFMSDGSVVIFPTDTVYGFASRLYDNEALQKIRQLKNEHTNHYFAVLCDTLVSVNDLAIIDERAKKLMMSFWPGALTIILKSSRTHFEKTGEEIIGVRIPNHQRALQLIKQNGPLVTTSITQKGQTPLMDLTLIKQYYQDKVEYIYEQYEDYNLNMLSTTVDLTEVEIKYLRIGSITREQIESVLAPDFQI